MNKMNIKNILQCVIIYKKNVWRTKIMMLIFFMKKIWIEDMDNFQYVLYNARLCYK